MPELKQLTEAWRDWSMSHEWAVPAGYLLTMMGEQQVDPMLGLKKQRWSRGFYCLLLLLLLLLPPPQPVVSLVLLPLLRVLQLLLLWS